MKSGDINAFIGDITGGEFTAKDFRMWNATLLAAVALSQLGPPPAARTRRRRLISSAVKEVAGYLGNTPAVCRRSYIDPRVFERYNAGFTIAHALEGPAGDDLGDPEARQGSVEQVVLELIEGDGTGMKATA